MSKNAKKIICFTLCIIVMVLSIPQGVMAASTKTVTVTFDANKGKVTTSSKSVNVGSKYGDLPKATREHYEFLGWYTFAIAGGKITNESVVSNSISHTLYAQWRGKQSEITLDANGGKLTNETLTVYYGAKYQLPNPTKENYTFTGWYTAEKGGKKVKSNSFFDSTSKKVLYAHWTEKTLTITFIAFEGEQYEKEVKCGNKYGTLPKPTRKNETFAGWYTWNDYSNIDAKPITSDCIVTESDQLRLFARWYGTNYNN